MTCFKRCLVQAPFECSLALEEGKIHLITTRKVTAQLQNSCTNTTFSTAWRKSGDPRKYFSGCCDRSFHERIYIMAMGGAGSSGLPALPRGPRIIIALKRTRT